VNKIKNIISMNRQRFSKDFNQKVEGNFKTMIFAKSFREPNSRCLSKSFCKKMEENNQTLDEIRHFAKPNN
jgi:hypothetical protein